MAKQISFTDTGKNELDGSIVFNQVNGGNSIPIYASEVRGEFGTNQSDNTTLRNDDAGNLTFNNTSITAVIVPRYTIKAFVPVSNNPGQMDANQTIKHLIELRNTQGIKKLSGGLSLLASTPESYPDSEDFVHVAIKNITFTENTGDSSEMVNVTIQCDQVR